MSIKGEFSKQASAWSAYLSDCISNGKKQKVEEFLQDYPSAAYLPLEHGQSPLYFAYKCKKLEIFCLLLDNGASPDTDTLPVSRYARFMTRLARPLLARPDAFPIIERVVKNGDIDFLLPLIERGADTSGVWPELAPQRSRNSVRILIDHAPEHRARHLESVKRDLIESQYLEQFETELERENWAKIDMKLDRETYIRAVSPVVVV